MAIISAILEGIIIMMFISALQDIKELLENILEELKKNDIKF